MNIKANQSWMLESQQVLLLTEKDLKGDFVNSKLAIKHNLNSILAYISKYLKYIYTLN